MTAAPLMAASTDLLSRATGVQIVAGIDGVRAHRGELEALAQRCGAAITARSTWTLANAGTGQPWAVLVRDPSGFLRAASVFVEVGGTGRTAHIVTFAGSDLGHRGAVLADDKLWARRLGIALSRTLPARSSGWAVELGPLDPGSNTLAGFLAGFPQLVPIDVDPIPMIRREPGLDEATDYLTPAMRRTLRKATNRLATDYRTFKVHFTRSEGEIRALMPALEESHRNRDHDRGRASDLEDDVTLQTWRSRLTDLALDGMLEVATAHIDGTLAAHVIGIRDGDSYRVLESHFVTAWARYAPGRLVEAAVVQRMLDEPEMVALDWMTSVAPESLLATNAAAPMVMLRAGLGQRR
ncbi:MAG TPA: GNAT family N-acetyltransferase [Acidothermaceae bacterium]|nr:GNAT family N-acetyltransferase [Acidothermaceae bacterium]